MKPLLEVKNLSVTFKTVNGHFQAIKDLNFQLYKGEIVGLVGESGSGKSLTAQAIMGLIQPEGTEQTGEIWLEETNVLTYSDQEMEHIRGKKISLIFQDPATALNPTMKIGYQVTEVLRKHERMNKQEAQEKALHLLQQVGLTDVYQRFHQYPHELSGGMRQRVLIAIAIACHPAVLIADEPTTGLDVTIQAQILDLFKDIQKRLATTILLITHDLGVLARLCDRVLVMYGGSLVEAGPIDAIFYQTQHPYTQGLLKSRQSLSCLTYPLFAIPGAPPRSLDLSQACQFASRCPHTMPICRENIPPLSLISSCHQSACWLSQIKEKS